MEESVHIRMTPPLVKTSRPTLPDRRQPPRADPSQSDSSSTTRRAPHRLTRRRAVHCAEHGHLRNVAFDTERQGDRGVEVVLAGRIDQATITGHGSEYAGLDLAEVGSHDAMAWLGRRQPVAWLMEDCGGRPMPTCVRRRRRTRHSPRSRPSCTCSSSQCQPNVVAMRSSLRQVRSASISRSVLEGVRVARPGCPGGRGRVDATCAFTSPGLRRFTG